MTEEMYVERRNALIPFAERHADEQCGATYFQIREEDTREDWTNRWNRAFHAKMNELSREVGLTQH